MLTNEELDGLEALLKSFEQLSFSVNLHGQSITSPFPFGVDYELLERGRDCSVDDFHGIAQALESLGALLASARREKRLEEALLRIRDYNEEDSTPSSIAREVLKDQ